MCLTEVDNEPIELYVIYIYSLYCHHPHKTVPLAAQMKVV